MNTNKTNMKKYTSILILFMSIWTYGQESAITRDLESWSSLNLIYKINKKWTMALQGQLRLENNSSEVDQYFGQLNLEYSPFKNIEFTGALRYIKKNDNTGNIQGYENHFRYHLDALYKSSLNRFKFKYRVRYQNKNELSVDDVSKQYVRFKTELEYNIKKWKLDPEISGELFHSVGAASDKQLEGYRLTIGTSFKVHKSAKIGVFYRFDKELNTTYPQATNIIGVKYTYNLN